MRVRDALSQARHGNFGYVAASAAVNGAYVASNWADIAHPQAVEVAPVSPDRAPLWHRTLPDTVNANAGTTFSIYIPALAPLADGDALVACALNGEVQLYRFDRDTGKQ